MALPCRCPLVSDVKATAALLATADAAIPCSGLQACVNARTQVKAGTMGHDSSQMDS